MIKIKKENSAIRQNNTLFSRQNLYNLSNIILYLFVLNFKPKRRKINE